MVVIPAMVILALAPLAVQQQKELVLIVAMQTKEPRQVHLPAF
jgi:hypothetical protein